MKRETWFGLCVFCFLVLVAVSLRLASNELEIWNFAPVTASALFAGYFFTRRWVAAAVPLLTLTLSNQFLPEYRNPYEMLIVYGAMALPVVVGHLLRRVRTAGWMALGVLSGAMASSVLFFLITNFSYWLVWFDVHSPATLLACYAQAIPFFRPTLASDLVWSAIFFGAYAFAGHAQFSPAMAEARVRAD